MSTLSVGKLQGLPVNSNVMTVPSGHTLYAPGHVLQVVQGTYSTQMSGVLSSSAWATTNLTATITPKSATSKILILVNTVFERTGSDMVIITVFRGTTSGVNLGNSTWGFTFTNTSAVPASISYLDSPATTSAQTYTVGWKSYTASSTLYIHDNSTPSTITLMEIAA